MKNLKHLGPALSKQEQQAINGGLKSCWSHAQCVGCCSTNSTCITINNGQGLCDGNLPDFPY